MHPWRKRLERLFTPIARRVPFSPNAITSFALVLNLSAAVALGFASRDARLFLVAVVFLGFAGILDALDGIVARLRGTATRFGDFLDHFCDRVSDTSLVAGWTIGASINLPLAVTTLVLVSLTGYVGTQIEATFRVRSYEGLGRGEFVLGFFTLPLVAFTLTRAGLVEAAWLGLTALEWLTGLMAASSLLVVVQRVHRAGILSKESEESDG